MNRSLYILAAAALLLLVGGWALWSFLSPGDSKPASLQTASAPPPAQNLPTNADLAKSIAFPATVVSVDDKSITFLADKDKFTLPIDKWTSLVALKSIKDIKPNSTIGIRLTADKKRVLVLNGSWMDQ